MALTFDTHEAIRKLRGKGHDEAQAEGVVEFVADATSELVTTEHFHAGMERLEARMDARFEEGSARTSTASPSSRAGSSSSPSSPS